MSLSARIVLRPSRRLAVCETLLVGGGFVAAAVALVARWPAAAAPIAVAVVACGLLACLVGPRRTGATVVVSDRIDVGLTAAGVVGDDGAAWRLAEGTLVWPGFSVVALAADGGARLTFAAFDRDLATGDRRALHRFLLWTLRGGVAGRPADA